MFDIIPQNIISSLFKHIASCNGYCCVILKRAHVQKTLCNIKQIDKLLVSCKLVKETVGEEKGKEIVERKCIDEVF